MTDSSYRFRGRERVTIELDGWVDDGTITLPRGLELDLDGGRPRVRLFAFHVDALRITGVPFVRSSYGELLWRVAVRARGEPAWWVAACDLDAVGPRIAAERFVRYPVRRKHVEVTSTRVASEGSLGRWVASLDAKGATDGEATIEHRALRTGANAEWRVPWGDDGVKARTVAVRIEVDTLSVATLGAPVRWAERALVREGREHRCGISRRDSLTPGPSTQTKRGAT